MKGLISPHILLAASNPLKMIHNLAHLLNAGEIAKLSQEVDRNAITLFALGQSHYEFALGIDNQEWRQKISRLYYAAYNMRRAIVLKNDGSFSTDSSDHLKIDNIPTGIKNQQKHINILKSLREDRNLADYSHFAQVSDLVNAPNNAQTAVVEFRSDCIDFLNENGINI
jgi:hypothetical protein